MQDNEQLAERHDGPEGARLEFERLLPAPAERVWDALTRPELIARWLFPERVEFEPARRLVFHFHGGHTDGGAILVWDPPRALAFEWGDRSVVRFSLEPDGEQTRLRLTHERLAAEIPGTLTGWHSHLVALAALLGGHALEFEEWRAAFDALAPRYGARPHREYAT